MALERELAAFSRELPRLLAEPANCGRYVLIHGEDLAGLWPTLDEALQAGYDHFGLDAFLVQQVVEEPPTRFFSRSVSRCH